MGCTKVARSLKTFSAPAGRGPSEVVVELDDGPGAVVVAGAPVVDCTTVVEETGAICVVAVPVEEGVVTAVVVATTAARPQPAASTRAAMITITSKTVTRLLILALPRASGPRPCSLITPLQNRCRCFPPLCRRMSAFAETIHDTPASPLRPYV
jgi:hypothetical protein